MKRMHYATDLKMYIGTKFVKEGEAFTNRQRICRACEGFFKEDADDL